MSTELSSAKYLSPELVQPAVETAPIAATAAAEGAPDYSPAPFAAPTAYAAQPSGAKWTVMLSVITMLLGLAGFFGVLGGSFGALGHLALTNNDSIQQAAFKGHQGEEAIIMQRTLAKREQFSTVILLHNGVCVLIGLGFLASCVLLALRKTDANSFASTMCFAAIFYNGLTLVVAYLLLPSFENLPNMPDGAAGIAWSVAIGATAMVTLFKIGTYVFMMNYLSKSKIKALFAPKTASPHLA